MSRPRKARLQHHPPEQPSEASQWESLADFLNTSEQTVVLEQPDLVPAVTAFVALRSRLVRDRLIK